jgi:hypothetical protein
MSGILRAVSSFAAQGRYQEVRSGLPLTGWLDIPGRFRLGYPWPWREIPDHSGIVGADASSATNEVLGALQAPRLQGVAVVLLWRAPGSLRSLEPAAGPRFGRLYNGSCREVRRVRVAGAAGIVVDVDLLVGDRVSRALLADDSDHVVHVELRVPVAAAQGYRAHFDAMLASWSWR